MKKVMIPAVFIILLAGCQSSKQDHLIQGKTEVEEIAVTGKIAGRISEIRVREGDFVKKGDTLAILNIPEVAAKKAQAAGAVESAGAQYRMTVKGATDNQLKQLNARQSALQEQYDFAQKSINRLENMVRDSLIPQQTYDEAYARYQGAAAQLAAVKAEIADVQHGVRIEQQMMALGQKNRAEGAMQEVDIAENERYILAPADMTVGTITLKEGELALPGYTLFKGAMPGTTYFRFTLPENDLDKIKKGMDLRVHIHYADRDVDGTVVSVKQLPAYANIATAYPDYEIQQSLFEIRVVPKAEPNVQDIFPNTTVSIRLPGVGKP